MMRIKTSQIRSVTFGASVLWVIGAFLAIPWIFEGYDSMWRLAVGFCLLAFGPPAVGAAILASIDQSARMKIETAVRQKLGQAVLQEFTVSSECDFEGSALSTAATYKEACRRLADVCCYGGPPALLFRWRRGVLHMVYLARQTNAALFRFSGLLDDDEIEGVAVMQDGETLLDLCMLNCGPRAWNGLFDRHLRDLFGHNPYRYEVDIEDRKALEAAVRSALAPMRFSSIDLLEGRPRESVEDDLSFYTRAMKHNHANEVSAQASANWARSIAAVCNYAEEARQRGASCRIVGVAATGSHNNEDNALGLAAVQDGQLKAFGYLVVPCGVAKSSEATPTLLDASLSLAAE